MIELAGISVPMTPDHSVHWVAHNTAEGTLLVRPDSIQAEQAAARLVDLASRGRQPDADMRHLGTGTEAAAYGADGVAYKIFQYVTSEQNAGLAAIRATVTMETALERYDCTTPRPFLQRALGRLMRREACDHPAIHYTAPTTYAALLQDREQGRTSLFAMSEEAGVNPNTVGVKLNRTYIHCQEALATCEADRGHVYPDVGPDNSNRLVRKRSDGGGDGTEAVILDVRAGMNMLSMPSI